jgi:hypothetical protein
MGLPKLYHVYRDESLNQQLRDVCQFCHRRTYMWRSHRLFDMLGRLTNLGLASQGDALSLMAWPRRR